MAHSFGSQLEGICQKSWNDNPITVLTAISAYPILQRQMCLEHLAMQGGYNWPSSVIRMRLHKDSGDIWRAQHTRLDKLPPEFRRRIELRWRKNLEDSPLKAAIIARSRSEPIGFGDRKSLVSDHDWDRSSHGRMAKSLHGILLNYGWIKLSDHELWVFALRGFLTKDDRGEKFAAFGSMLLNSKEIWWSPIFDQFPARVQYALCASLWAPHCSRAGLAEYMQLSGDSSDSRRLQKPLFKSDVDEMLGEAAQILKCKASEVLEALRTNSSQDRWYCSPRKDLVPATKLGYSEFLAKKHLLPTLRQTKRFDGSDQK